jgi:hypothetical protein
MIDQRDNRPNLWESVAFIVLFLLSVYTFSTHLTKHADRTFQSELTAALHTDAPAIVEFKNFSAKRNKADLPEKTILKLHITGIYTFAENKALNQKIILLQKNKFIIKPLLKNWFYCRYQYPSEDLPDLS